VEPVDCGYGVVSNVAESLLELHGTVDGVIVLFAEFVFEG
jgi:hypothetical protein